MTYNFYTHFLANIDFPILALRCYGFFFFYRVRGFRQDFSYQTGLLFFSICVTYIIDFLYLRYQIGTFATVK